MKSPLNLSRREPIVAHYMYLNDGLEIQKLSPLTATPAKAVKFGISLLLELAPRFQGAQRHVSRRRGVQGAGVLNKIGVGARTGRGRGGESGIRLDDTHLAQAGGEFGSDGLGVDRVSSNA